MDTSNEFPWVTPGTEKPNLEWGNYCHIGSNNKKSDIYIQIIKNKSLYVKTILENGHVTNTLYNAMVTKEIIDYIRRQIQKIELEENKPTEVMFRKEKRKDGNIYAVFPYLSWKHNYEVMGYAHLGQHQACKWEYVVCNTKPAKPKEYADLYRELRSIGYRLKVIKRACHKKMYKL